MESAQRDLFRYNPREKFGLWVEPEGVFFRRLSIEIDVTRSFPCLSWRFSGWFPYASPESQALQPQGGQRSADLIQGKRTFGKVKVAVGIFGQSWISLPAAIKS